MITIQEKNEAIAVLVGYKICECGSSSMGRHYKLDGAPNWSVLMANQMKYHSSWEWVHGAVDVIHKLMPEISIPRDLEAMKAGTHGSERHIDVLSMPMDTPIEEAFEKLYEFANWHNNQPK